MRASLQPSRMSDKKLAAEIERYRKYAKSYGQEGTRVLKILSAEQRRRESWF
uniref:Uncharacterized protein n=1 Tax=viral metagenome TaxID=1070528 RepID=A0A6M3IKP3_9ZZZZ